MWDRISGGPGPRKSGAPAAADRGAGVTSGRQVRSRWSGRGDRCGVGVVMEQRRCGKKFGDDGVPMHLHPVFLDDRGDDFTVAVTQEFHRTSLIISDYIVYSKISQSLIVQVVKSKLVCNIAKWSYGMVSEIAGTADAGESEIT
eukprot:g29591.t1